jgi:hypothetical protein
VVSDGAVRFVICDFSFLYFAFACPHTPLEPPCQPNRKLKDNLNRHLVTLVSDFQKCRKFFFFVASLFGFAGNAIAAAVASVLFAVENLV